jgi:hypothetical protein
MSVCRTLLSLFLISSLSAAPALAQGPDISGTVTDPQGNVVANVTVSLVADDGKPLRKITTRNNGQFTFAEVLPGKYSLKVIVAGFDAANQPLLVRDGEPLTANVQLKLATAKEEVRVSTDVLDVNVMTPDPAQRSLIRQETLDANPGRPGAPVSIPGLSPVRTVTYVSGPDLGLVAEEEGFEPPRPFRV